MTYPWYREVTSAEPISQGEIIEDLPVLTFREVVEAAENLDAMKQGLQNAAGVQPVRAVIMTQACDLEHDHVRYVQLCPASSLAEFKANWEAAESARGQSPTTKNWTKAIEEIRRGRAWNYTMLSNRVVEDGGVAQDFLIVDFHEVFSLPITFLRAWVRLRGERRLQLSPPYREHLSQSFARYFMRVGLPIDIRLPT